MALSSPLLIYIDRTRSLARLFLDSDVENKAHIRLRIMNASTDFVNVPFYLAGRKYKGTASDVSYKY